MFPNTPTRSPPGSPMSEDSVPHAIPSIASIFPPNYSGSDGSAFDEMIPQYSNSISIIFPPTKSETESSESNQRFGQFSHSISSVFPPTKSQTDQSSESNQILTRFSQYSISSIFPPTKSQSESSESNQTSYSISSVFPPTKSQTDQSSESNLGNTTTSASTPPPQPNSTELEADSVELDSGAQGEEPARTLKLVWTPQLHKRFVDAVAHLGIKNAVPETIMQLMSVDGLTRENVASHLQKYIIYLKRMQGISAGGGGSSLANGAGGLAAASAAPATDHLFASSPVPPHFLHLGLPNSDHFLPFGQVAALPHHHHHHPQQTVATVAYPQRMVATVAYPQRTVAHPQLQPPFHRQVGHIGSPPNGQFQHPFLSTRQSQPVHRMGAPLHNQGPGGGYGEDLELANGAGGRKVLTLFPTRDD